MPYTYEYPRAALAVDCVVFGLDEANYRHALVSGPDKSYLWILARTPTLDKAVLDALVARASAAGFDTGKLIFVSHE